MSNQCMGCQAGWPLIPGHFSTRPLHEVIGGYHWEVVGCTAERYLATSSTKEPLPPDPVPQDPGEDP